MRIHRWSSILAALGLAAGLLGCAGDGERASSGGGSAPAAQLEQQDTGVIVPPDVPQATGRVLIQQAASIESFQLDPASGALFDKQVSSTFFNNIHFNQPMMVVPDGRFAYVPSFVHNTIGKYTAGPVPGSFALSGTFATGGVGPQWVETNRAGSVLYVPNHEQTFGIATLSVFKIHGASGDLTPFPGSPFPLTQSAFVLGIAVHPAGDWVFVHQGNQSSATVKAYAVNAQQGTFTEIGSAAVGAGTNGGLMNSIAVSASGTQLYVTNAGPDSLTVLAFNQGNGALTPVGPAVPTISDPGSVSVEPSGRFAYVANRSGQVAAFSLDPTTGAATAIGTPVQTFANATVPFWSLETIAVDPAGNFVFANSAHGTLGADGFRIDPVTGELTHLAGYPLPGLNTKRVVYTALTEFSPDPNPPTE